jgi:hypothetical protein
MNAQFGLASTWKHMAEEREVAARRMARIAIGLFIICNVLAATSFSAQSRYSTLCGLCRPAASYEGTLGRVLLTDYCR